MERIDLWLEVDRISPDELSKKKSIIKESDEIRKKIQSARAIQAKRFEGKKILKNSEMSTRDMVTHVRLENDALNTLNLATQRLGFSPRVYHKLSKVARTIADLDERAKKVFEQLHNDLQMLEMKKEIQKKVHIDISKQQREYFLHQQLNLKIQALYP